MIGTFFLSFLNIGSHIVVSLDMNLLIYCNRPINPRICFSVLGGGIDMIALILVGSISIPLELMTYPKRLPEVTPKAHLDGFNLILYFLSLSKNFLKATLWPGRSFDFTIMSSTYNSTSLCIMSWSKAVA